MTTETETRQFYIDSQLFRCGWEKSSFNLIDEFLLSGYSSYEQGDIKEFVDYVLFDQAGKPIAIVEAKKTSRDPLAGKRQASDYADRINEKFGIEPFIFLSNGMQTWFWDRQNYPLRVVSGFFTLADLTRLDYQRKNRKSFSAIKHNKSIINRLYQVEAVKRVTEAIEQGRRKFLLVMATGTGKTRTAIALIDVLMRSNWVKQVLFLADRRELVKQALGDFKEHLPNQTRSRVEGGDIDLTANIHVATYPSMMQAYQHLSPGFYDLIIADESHRSIYNRYKTLFDYFDAMQLGLTATPTDYIDHNTFELFESPDGLPTFYYPYEQAIGEEYLAQYRVLEALTNFQIQGIKAGQLPSEFQKQLEEQGIDLSEVNFEGSELERQVTNTGTNDAIVQEFMAKCRRDASGTLPAKTIIFAMSHRHAVELWKSFNRLYPDLQRRGMVEIIDSHMERAEKTLDDFKYREMPRIAISVDMLDTGIDIPSLQNLVFAKPVYSQVKFWQMIGRGTRRWVNPQTGETKTDFLIIDFWNNFAYFNMNPEGEVANPTEALPVRLFRTRLEKLVLLRGLGEQYYADQTVLQLQDMLGKLPNDNINIRPFETELNELAQSATWSNLSQDQYEHLSKAIAPLLRYQPDVNFGEMLFEARTERLTVAWLTGDTNQTEQLREQITQDIKSLPQTLKSVQAQVEKIAWVNSDGFWEHLDYNRLQDLQVTFTPLMRYRQQQKREMVQLHLPDRIVTRKWIVYGPSGEGAFAESYREQVEALVKDMADSHPTMNKLRRGEQLVQSDIEVLSNLLNQADLFITEDILKQVYERPDATITDFLQHILGLSRLPSREEQIKNAFEEFIANHPYFNSTQVNFLRVVRSAVLRRAKLSTRDLEKPPFTNVGRVSELFSEDEIDEILTFANNLAA
jgi:type I restriction enzyme R subunit